MKKLLYRPKDAWVGDLIPYYENGTFYGYYLHDPRIRDKEYAEETTWHLVTTKDFVNVEYKGEAIKRGGDDKSNKNAYTGSVIKDKENGLLIEPGNIEQLTSSLKIAINDKLKCNEMAEKAYQTVNAKFNEKDMINNIEMIYKALIYKNIKLCLTSSAGGHFMQLKQLFKMANKYDWFIVTEKNTISMQLKNKYKMKFLIQQERKSVDFIFKFGLNIFKSIWIIYSQNPDVIISTGAGATYVLCKLVKLTGGKVIFSESFAKIKSPTVTGQKVYKFADDFYVQWPEMLKFYPNAKYKGGIY